MAPLAITEEYGLLMLYKAYVLQIKASMEYSCEKTAHAIRCLEQLQRLEFADDVLKSYPCIDLLINDLRLEGWRRIAVRAQSNQRLMEAQKSGVPNEELVELWMDSQRSLLDLAYEQDCDEPHHLSS